MTENRRYLGKIEIAELLKVKRGTVTAWVQRRGSRVDGIPEPDHPDVNGGDTWSFETIRDWAVATGRWPYGNDQ